MKMPILNIIISFFLIFQFSLGLGNLDILFKSNISKANEIYSIESCNEAEESRGCRTIKILVFFERCICPPIPREKTDL